MNFKKKFLLPFILGIIWFWPSANLWATTSWNHSGTVTGRYPDWVSLIESEGSQIPQNPISPRTLQNPPRTFQPPESDPTPPVISPPITDPEMVVKPPPVTDQEIVVTPKQTDPTEEKAPLEEDTQKPNPRERENKR